MPIKAQLAKQVSISRTSCARRDSIQERVIDLLAKDPIRNLSMIRELLTLFSMIDCKGKCMHYLKQAYQHYELQDRASAIKHLHSFINEFHLECPLCDMSEEERDHVPYCKCLGNKDYAHLIFSLSSVESLTKLLNIKLLRADLVIIGCTGRLLEMADEAIDHFKRYGRVPLSFTDNFHEEMKKNCPSCMSRSPHDDLSQKVTEPFYRSELTDDGGHAMS